MKKIMLLPLCAAFIATHAQTIPKSITLNGARVNTFDNDSTLSAMDSTRLPTQRAVYKFVTSRATGSSTSQWNTYGQNIAYNAGKVGIGTSIPQGQLHIVGPGAPRITGNGSPISGNLVVQANTTDGRTGSQGASLEFVLPAGTNGTNPWGQARILALPGNTLDGSASGKMVLGTRRSINGWEYGDDLAIDASGNVGIGTTVPQAKLEVNSGSDGTSGLRLANLKTKIVRGVVQPIAVDQAGNVVPADDYLHSYEGTVSAASMANNFNLPPYTADGTAKLAMITSDTYHAGGGIGMLHADYMGSPVVWLYDNVPNAFTVGIARYCPNGAADIGDSITPILQVRQTGRVGIGTTNPQAKLEVNSGDYNTSGLRFTNFTSGGGVMPIGVDALGRVVAVPGSSAYNAPAYNRGNMFWTDTANNGTGCLNIGKVARPSLNGRYALRVAGNILADKVTVTTTGADFVFEPSYQLKPLSELENYIALNQHLPDIAPAAEMQKDGVEVGDSQTKLLQKIEELTLYIIQQNKKITEQDKRITELETRTKR